MPDNEKNVLNSEILIDTGSVCVKTDRYQEIIRAEATLQIIENMYRSSISTYDYDTFFSFIFGKKGENGNAE